MVIVFSYIGFRLNWKHCLVFYISPSAKYLVVAACIIAIYDNRCESTTAVPPRYSLSSCAFSYLPTMRFTHTLPSSLPPSLGSPGCLVWPMVLPVIVIWFRHVSPVKPQMTYTISLSKYFEVIYIHAYVSSLFSFPPSPCVRPFRSLEPMVTFIHCLAFWTEL